MSRAPGEAGADGGQREAGGGIGGGVEGERQERRGAVERAAERRAEDPAQRILQLLLGDGGGELRLGDHARQGGGFGEAVDDRERPLDERDEHDLRDRQGTEEIGDGDARQGQRAPCAAEDHRQLAVPAIDQRAGGQGEEEVGDSARRRHEARHGGGAGEGEDQQREGDLRHLRPDDRDQLPAPEQEVVAVAPERGELCCFPRHCRSLPSFDY